MGTQLPHLCHPHKIKKIRQDETKTQNINLVGSCTLRLSLLGRKRLALAGTGICVGQLLIRLHLTIVLAITAYILAYVLIIGAILWLLIP